MDESLTLEQFAMTFSSFLKMDNQEYFEKFNLAYKDHKTSPSEENTSLVNRYLVLISSLLDPAKFDPINTETCHFYINLYELIEEIDPQSSLLWSAIAALHQTINNVPAQELNKKFNYLPILTKLLYAGITGKFKILKILSIIQKLSYKHGTNWNDVHVKNLIKILLKFLFTDEDELIYRSGSVLVNLCFNCNSAVHYTMCTAIPEDIFQRLESHKLLRFKMQYILKDVNKWSFNLPVGAFVDEICDEIQGALNERNSDKILHVVDFFVDLQANCKQYLENYQDCNKFIEELILMSENVLSDAKLLTASILLSMKYLTTLFCTVIQLGWKIDRKIHDKLLEFSLKWCHLQHVSSESFNLITILATDKRFNVIDSGFSKLLMLAERFVNDLETSISLNKLLTQLAKSSPEIMEQFPINFFMAFSEKVKGYSTREVSALSTLDVKFIMSGLELLNVFPEPWSLQLDQLLRHETVITAICKALTSHNVEFVSIVLKMMQRVSFPGESVAVAIANLNKPTKDQEIINGNHCLVNYFDKTLNEILISESLQDQIEDSTVADLIEMFEYKMYMSSCNELNLMEKIEKADTEVTALSQQNSLLETELLDNKMENKILIETIKKFENDKMALNYEKKVFKAEIECLKQDMKIFNGKYEELKKNLYERERMYNDLKQSITAEEKTCSSYKKSLKEAELHQDKLQALIVTLQNKIAQLEEITQQLNDKLSEENRRNEAALTQIQHCNEENQSLKHENDKLMKKIHANEALITEFEMSMKEIETMRHRVIEIVQKKKEAESQKSE